MRMQTLPDGKPVASLEAEWFRAISNILATIKIVMVINQDYAEIIRTESGKGWELRIPSGGSGSGLPDGTEATPHAVWDNSNEEWKAGLILQPGTATGQLAYWDNSDGEWKLLDAGKDKQILKTNATGIPEWTTGSLLPSNADKSKWMVLTLSGANATGTDNPDLWTVDWVRAHA